jgi:hypothetical protein
MKNVEEGDSGLSSHPTWKTVTNFLHWNNRKGSRDINE